MKLPNSLKVFLITFFITQFTIAQNSDSTVIWNKYDFIPAEKILFYDDLQNEEYGEFPSKWDIYFGNVEIAKLNEEKVIQFKETRFGSGIFPLINKKDYISGYTTIELDIYLDDSFFKKSESWYFGLHSLEKKSISFFNHDFIDGDGIRKKTPEYGGKINIYSSNGYLHLSFSNKFKTSILLEELSETKGWHHIAISIDEQKLKFYFDNHKLLNIPNIDFNPTMFFLGANDYKSSINTAKNIKISLGGDTFYNRIISESNYITRGILFDTGKAIIKPQSTGVLKKIINALKENLDWKFEIIGHTDSDGNTELNLVLSKERANAVKKALTNNGIDGTRLTTSGKGEAEPLNKNSSAEEKANNRRVEFILLK